jgi:hypothetical protein
MAQLSEDREQVDHHTGVGKVMEVIKECLAKGGVRIGKTPKKLASICGP